jgi:aminoglycoside phosphotransferase family enzyme/predicted kinase
MREFQIQDLLQPGAYPHPVTQLELRQTHMSWVVLTGPFAYKIKKPVHFDFVDASTLEQRRRLCQEELRLNRRFSGELYVAVLPIVAAGRRLRIGGSGAPVEYAVQMHQFEGSQELASVLERKGATAEDMRAIADQVAGAHGRAAVARPDGPYGEFATVRQPMLDNFRLLRAQLQDAASTPVIERLAAWTDTQLDRHRPLIESRRTSGRIRECHGDLHSRNIVRWRNQWLPFDCLEFDPELRWIDVVSDTAFLFMDLMSWSRPDLACEFQSRYLEQTGDYHGLPLLPLYASYRALVRAKVDALGAGSAGMDERRELAARLASRLATAAEFMRADPPALLIMHGPTASGKSWLSERLVGAVPALRIRSDLERKRLAGADPLAQRRHGVGEGAYTPAENERTYRRLHQCATSALDGGCNVVIDAAFLQAAQRERFFALARERRARFLIVSCHADRAALLGRLEARVRSGRDPSEATREVLEAQLRNMEPLTPEERALAIEVDTDSPADVDTALRRVRETVAPMANGEPPPTRPP